MPMLDWTTYRKQISAGVRHIGELSPETVRGYSTLAAPGPHPPRFDERTRELIALAVAVALRCDGCIAVHAEAARRLGAHEEEVAAALRVAVSVSTGAALVYSIRTLDAFAAAADERSGFEGAGVAA